MIRTPKRPKKATITSPGTTGISSEAVPEQITLTTDIKPIHALNSPQQENNPAITIDDFDEEDVTNAYGALLESGALMIADVEITLNEDRIKRRGKQIFKIMKKYNLNFEYMDLMFVGVGVLGDCINVYQQLKLAKHEQGGQTEETATTTPASTKKPQEQQDFKALQAMVKI